MTTDLIILFAIVSPFALVLCVLDVIATAMEKWSQRRTTIVGERRRNNTRRKVG